MKLLILLIGFQLTLVAKPIVGTYRMRIIMVNMEGRKITNTPFVFHNDTLVSDSNG
jgi:hypothetical protein